MERKEFSSVEEAIEALNDIKSIDYSSVEGVDELTEREFYNSLMNNFVGTKNLKFTKEERDNYKEALRKKGLISYRDWKDRQPNSDEKMTWKQSVEKGSLDAPVNIFSHLLQADDEKKFEYIRDIVNNEEKSDIGKMWVENNTKIIDKVKENQIEPQIESEVKLQAEAEQEIETKENTNDLSKYDLENIADQALNEVLEEMKGNNLTKEVSKIEQIEENELENTLEQITDEEKLDIEEAEELDSEFLEKNDENTFKFTTPKEAIDALKEIEKFEYKKGKDIDTIKEKEFYSKIMENLKACGDLKFNADEVYQYKKALENIGCKKQKILKDYRKGTKEDISVPAGIVDTILKSQREGDHQGFKSAKASVQNNEELNKWLEDSQKVVENAHKTEEKALVPYKKKPSLFKRIKTYGAIAAASFAALFGVGKMASQNTERAEEANENAHKIEREYTTDRTKEETIKEKFVKRDFSDELREDVKDEAKTAHKEEKEVVNNNSHNYNYNYGSRDQNYTKTPDKKAEVYGEANRQEMKEVQENKEKKAEAEKAKAEAEKNNIEVVVTPEESEKGTSDNSTIDSTGGVGNVESSTSKEPEKVVVEDSGKITETTPETPSNNSGQTVEDDREVVDMGVIDFGEPQTYSDVGSGTSETVEEISLEDEVAVVESEEKDIEEDDLTL